MNTCHTSRQASNRSVILVCADDISSDSYISAVD